MGFRTDAWPPDLLERTRSRARTGYGPPVPVLVGGPGESGSVPEERLLLPALGLVEELVPAIDLGGHG